MEEFNDWEPVKMVCPQCHKLITGYKRKDGSVKYQCSRCKAVSISVLKNNTLRTVTYLKPKQINN